MQDILTEAGAKEYPDWPGYWVLPTGVIIGPRGKPLKPWLTGSGYYAIKLGKHQSRNVHVIVARTFVGPKPESLEVRHLDGNKLNNTATNLSYCTRSENNSDRVKHGVHPNANKTHCSRGHEYTEENTRMYRNRRMCRQCQRDSNAGVRWPKTSSFAAGAEENTQDKEDR